MGLGSFTSMHEAHSLCPLKAIHLLYLCTIATDVRKLKACCRVVAIEAAFSEDTMTCRHRKRQQQSLHFCVKIA